MYRRNFDLFIKYNFVKIEFFLVINKGFGIYENVLVFKFKNLCIVVIGYKFVFVLKNWIGIFFESINFCFKLLIIEFLVYVIFCVNRCLLILKL